MSGCLFEFFDPVFAVCPCIVDVPYLVQWEVKVGYIATEAIAR